MATILNGYDPVPDWPEQSGSYYNRAWRGYVEAFGIFYGEAEPHWIRVAPVTSVEAGNAWIETNTIEGRFRIVDVGGNVYDEMIVEPSFGSFPEAVTA